MALVACTVRKLTACLGRLQLGLAHAEPRVQVTQELVHLWKYRPRTSLTPLFEGKQILMSTPITRYTMYILYIILCRIDRLYIICLTLF